MNRSYKGSAFYSFRELLRVKKIRIICFSSPFSDKNMKKIS